MSTDGARYSGLPSKGIAASIEIIKSGKVSVRDIRELKSVVETQDAVIGVFITEFFLENSVSVTRFLNMSQLVKDERYILDSNTVYSLKG